MAETLADLVEQGVSALDALADAAGCSTKTGRKHLRELETQERVRQAPGSGKKAVRFLSFPGKTLRGSRVPPILSRPICSGHWKTERWRHDRPHYPSDWSGYLTIDEAAEVARLSLWTARDLNRRGEFPGVKYPGRRRICTRRDWLDAYMAGAELEVWRLADGGRAVLPKGTRR